ncbi:unnamed protein product [Gongylonema pulchrum]|uniref:MARVEL domain-containing protein n=1 Tax=Gongylonema pulchrum TaxID=637853 RepID=A0A183D4B9_9BILA|nr:unnamed protein product [Gongylonema pulchrum]
MMYVFMCMCVYVQNRPMISNMYLSTLDYAATFCGLFVSCYMLFVSFYMVGNDSYKWYTVNIFVVCLAGSIIKLADFVVQHTVTSVYHPV